MFTSRPLTVAFVIALLAATGFTLYALVAESPPASSPLAQLGSPRAEGLLNDTLDAAAGATARRSFDVGARAAFTGQYMLTGTGAHLEFSSQGVPLPLSDVVREPLSTDAVLVTFTAAPSRAGAVDIVLTAGAEPASARFAIRFTDTYRLGVGLEPMNAKLGEPVHVSASLFVDAHARVRPTGAATVSVSVVSPDRQTETLALADDGRHGDGAPDDGEFGGTFTHTTREGHYDVRTTGVFPLGGEVVERSATSVFIVASGAAALVGDPSVTTPDANKNRRFDALVFTQQIRLVKNGEFRLTSDLVDAAGGPIFTLQTNYANTHGPGTYAVESRVPAAVLVRHGVPAPWSLKNRLLHDIGATVMSAASAPDFATAVYALDAFERPAPPKVAGVIPKHGPFSGSRDVTLSGGGFAEATSVLVGGQSVVFERRDDFTLGITVPPFSTPPPVFAPGEAERITVDIQVTTPWGTGVGPDLFVYQKE